MAAIGAISPSIWHSSPTKCRITSYVSPRKELKTGNPSLLSTFSIQKQSNLHSHFSLKASASSSVESTEYAEEPATKVKFQRSLSLPGCSTSLSLFGTGLYVNQSIFTKLDAWKGRSAADLQQDSSIFDTIFQAPSEKSLQIVLVRDVDGKTFWDALDEAISPRIKSPTPLDTTALSLFRSIFQGKSLNKDTFIFLTWLDSAKMLVSVSSDGLPSTVDATIESTNVTYALFNVFLGSDPVSPTLKASVTSGLAQFLT